MDCIECTKTFSPVLCDSSGNCPFKDTPGGELEDGA